MVSVIIPTRNRSTMLAQTLGSVLRQRDIRCEIVVVDEASTDDTQAVLSRLAAGVRVFRHDVPRGLAAARNSGAAEARGDWLAFLDDDDLWAPDKLQTAAPRRRTSRTRLGVHGVGEFRRVSNGGTRSRRLIRPG